ncbi:tetratricopeptide repeat protein [Roseiconus lacunae]|uniref:tetratricopeptide repeat protein n=1 Tax=Roseiconus lacunae TaxID=2605694 RepID=UPI0030921579|nr:tetratricopeptide repeat protein [Stieleria sp. HD01]
MLKNNERVSDSGSAIAIDFETVRKQLRRLSDKGLYLDAFQYAKSILGEDLYQWPDCQGGLIALKMADRLGGSQLSDVLTYRMGRRFPDDPEVRFLRTMQKLSRQPLARVWLQIRDQNLDTDDPELVSNWCVVKGLILCGMRDFDRGFEWLETGRELVPDDPRPLLRIATSYLCSDQMTRAIETCRTALELLPGFPPTIQTLSHLLLQDNQIDEAFDLLYRSIESNQSGSCRLQLATMEIQNRQYKKASELVENIEEFFPLADPLRDGRAKRDSVRSTIAKIRSELACHAGDLETSICLAHKANNPFHDTLAKNLENHGKQGKRVRLKVPFVRQNDVTCAPATLAMLSAYWGLEVDHDSVVDEICYDGTAPVKQRVWAESQGLIAREFRMTESSAQALIDAKIPFGISTVDPGGGHINVVCGYDSRRGVLLMQDPGTWHGIEALLKEFIEQYEAFGPRGLVLIPSDQKERLDAIELPDADKYDQQHAIAVALQHHDRDQAVRILETLQTSSPDHPIALWSETELARYDMNLPLRLKSIQSLRDKFPKNQLLTIAECDLLSMIDRQDKVIERLRECVKGETPSTESRLRLLMLLESEDDREERNDLLRQILKTAPTNPDGLSQESIRLWDEMKRDDALELLRLAAMSGERDEDHARRFLAAATRMNRKDEAIAILKERFEKHGHASGNPGLTYAYALARTTHADRAADVIREALAKRPDDAELLCEAASALGSFEKPSVGLELLENATIALPADQVLYAKANLAISDGHPKDALQAMLELYELQPMNFDAVNRIAELKADLEGLDSALTFLEAITSKFPHCRSLLSVTAEYLHRAARYKEAVEYLDRILETCDYDAWAWRERSLVCAAAGWYDEAHRSATRGLECERSAMSYNILAEALVGRGELDAARANCRLAMQSDCDHAPAMLTWIKLCENEAETRQILGEIFQQLIEQPSNGDGVIAYKRFSTGIVEDSELCEQLDGLRAVRPDVLIMHKVAADHHCECKRFDVAEKTLTDVQDRFSHLPEYWQFLGEVFLSKGDLPAALDPFEKALLLDPFNSELAIRTSHVYQAVERPKDAEQTLRRALGASPADSNLMVELGRVVEDDNERSTLILDAAMLAPNNGETWELLLSLCQYENRESDAVDAAKRLVAQRPHDSNANLRLAEMLHREDQWEESVAVIRSAIGRDPRNVDLHGLLAQRFNERDMVDEAIAACSPDGIDPFDLNQLNLYAANLLNLNGKTKEACDRILLALERDPTNLDGWRRLADWAESLEDNELYDRAANELLDRAPYLASSHGYIAATKLRQGSRDAAKEHLRHAIKLDKEYVYAIPELLGLYIDDNEISKIESLVSSMSDQAEPMPLAIAQSTLALAKKDYQGFVTVLQRLPDDQNPYYVCIESLKQFEFPPDGELASVLAKTMKRKNASIGVGRAWGILQVGGGDIAAAIGRFGKLPRNDAACEAAHELLQKVHNGCRSDDPETKKHFNRLALKLIRKLGSTLYSRVQLWEPALWMLFAGAQWRKASSVAAKFHKVENRGANHLVPAILAGLARRDYRLVGQLLEDGVTYRPDSIDATFLIVRAMACVHLAPVEDLREAIGLVNKNELDDSFKKMAKLVSSGVACIESQNGDEQALVQSWHDNFVAIGEDDLELDFWIYSELRAKVAESVGDRRTAKARRKDRYTGPTKVSPPKANI